jgi:hypothetical protein
MNRQHVVLLASIAGLFGCGDRPVFGLGEDTGVSDASFDALVDDTGPRDGGPDARLDTGRFDGGMTDGGLLDVSLPDGGLLDAPLDAGIDAGIDVGIDAGIDVGIDAGLDAGLDASTDVGVDTRTDVPTPDAGHLGPSPVLLGTDTDLRSAGAYVLIGKTGITNVIGSRISGGHVGVSPIDSTAITGLALILDSSGEFSSSVSVVPPARVYAADYATPTPSNLTAAILSMEGAYADAASRMLPDFLNLSSGHLGGLVLVPGLYTFGSSVDITAGITLLGGPNDVWIFQITGDLDLTAAMSMTLAGGARAENIFWQVAGSVTMHAGAHFEGIILCSTGITMETSASLHGRALAQTMVALDNNDVTAP